MSGAPHDRDTAPRAEEPGAEPIRYPTDHIIAVVDTDEQVADAVEALTAGGFLDSEITVITGAAAADRLRESNLRKGFVGLVVRIAERLGLEDEELEFKSFYERAMRNGQFVLLVSAPTEERKGRATQLLVDHGAHGISYHGKFTIEKLVPPSAP